MTTRLAALVSFCCSTLALAQAPTLTGVFSVVNNGPGQQTDPHVDCDLAPYTNDDDQGSLQIRYYDFATGTDHAVPGNGADSLSDVSGPRIAFTEGTALGSQVVIFNTATQSSTVIPGFQLRMPAIAGDQVAFEDRSFSTNPNESEIVVYDLGSSTATRITNDALFDKNPALSPNGNVLVWEKCQLTGLGCDIYSAVRTGPSTFSTQLLTGAGEDRGPDTNGNIVVYVSDKGGENDVYYQAVAGGPETHISIPGNQRDVSITGNLIAFESNGTGTQYDIYVYDLATSVLYQVTNTAVNETLNDISVCGGVGRIVYAVPAVDFDVLAFTFTPPAPPPPPPPPGDDCGAPEDACADPGDRPLLADLTVTRTTGHPNSASATFASSAQGALICINNHRATSGSVSINDRRVVGPDPFKHKVTSIAVRADGLLATNIVEASIAGQPGTSFQVKVYGDNPDCQCAQKRGPNRVSPDAQAVTGEHLTSVDRTVRMQYDPNEPLEGEATSAMGCSTTPGLALSALVVLALWLAARRRPVLARARRL